MEQWRKAPDVFKLSLYEFSNFGNYRKTKKTSYGTKNKSGYMVAHLIDDDNIKHTFRLHRLIAATWLILPDNHNDLVVNHINNIRHDNNVENLEWLTQKENSSAEKSLIRESNKGKGSRTEFTQIKSNEVIDWISISECYAYNKETFSKSFRTFMRCINKCLNDSTATFLDSRFEKKNVVVQLLLEGEEWKVVNYKGYDIEVSSFGRIKQSTGHISYGYDSGDGYLGLMYNAKCRVCVHIAVCLAFVSDKPDPKHSVDHKDRNPKNNHKDNLQWATSKEQCKNKSHRQPSLKIHQYDLEYNLLDIFVGCRNAALQLNIKEGQINSQIYNNVLNKNTKYIFSLTELTRDELYSKYHK